MKEFPPDLAELFRKDIEGEVRFDAYSKALYSTDASVWQMAPLGVIIPRDAAGVAATVEIAARHGIPVLPRGGASSLSGQTVGHAVHIDFAKYMNRILEVNTEEGWARVEPGVVQDQFNRRLAREGFGFGPDTSSSSRATLGGMIGNNSAGAHSILHGKTIDHVIELKVLLSDGSEAVFGPVDRDAAQAKARGDELVNRIYRGVLEIGERRRDEILARFPKLLRRVSGYNLDELVANGDCYGAGYSSSPGPLNLAKLITGSEGTLGVVREAKVRIVPLPTKKALMVVQFQSLFDAVDASQEMVATGPAAVELLDERILEAARAQPDFAGRMDFIEPQTKAFMVVEYYGESEAELRSRLEDLEARLRRNRMGFGYLKVLDSARQQFIWKVRKESLGLLMSVKGDRKPVAFVEDPAVPVENMPAFLRGFREILERYDAVGGYYGHASVGCLHVRPMIDLKQASEVEKMGRIANEVCGLVREFNGAMSGEHGDGVARGKYNRELFGDEIYEAFQRTKALFDPHNILNPNKVVEAPEPTENLRWGPDYRTVPVKTRLDFSQDGGYAGAIEMCNGAGVCRKQDAGVMCPSYHATLEEEHSTRGRANALRSALSGILPAGEFTSHRMYDVLDLCLECKGCKRECPSNVDLAKIKYEFLSHYYERHGTPLRARLFGKIATLNRWGSRFAPLANASLRMKPVQWAMDRFLGIDKRRQMPPFASPDFETWFRRRGESAASNGKPRVVLFHDCFNTYNYPETARAAAELLEMAGYQVVLADKVCCGRPMLSKGLIEDARQAAAHNVRVLAEFAREGVPVVGIEPSCLLTLRDEYPDLVSSPAVKAVAENAWMLDEFLLRLDKEGRLNLAWRDEKKQALFHGHCHQKALIGSGPSLAALRLAGIEVSEIDSGCCGMAGSFGFEKEHYEISEKIGRQRLFPAVEAAGAGAEIAVTGVSCRQQIAHFTSRRPRHVAEVLRDAAAS